MKKIYSKRGFTLAELLVVVAIIAVLVAVSIPIFTGKLEKAREATDIGNMRAAKAAAVTIYLTNDKTDDTVNWNANDDGFYAYYNAATGKLQKSTTGITTYGKGTAIDGGCEDYMDYKKDTVASEKMIRITVSNEGTVSENWYKNSNP